MVLPQELDQMSKSVSAEKRNEVQNLLNKVFTGVAKMREQLDNITVADENDKVNMKLCGTLRLGVKQERLAGEKIFDTKRDEVQQQMVSFKTEDSLWLKSKQVMQILTKEIEENARWKEETAKRFEAEKKELKVQERILAFSKLDYIDRIERSEFENLSDESFALLFAGIEKQYNDKIELEAKAEQERIAVLKAEAEAKAAMEAENKRLREVAEAKENQIQAENKAKVVKVEKFIEILLADGYKCTALNHYSKGSDGNELGYGVSKEQLLSLNEKEFDERLKEVNSILIYKAKAEAERKAIEIKTQKEKAESDAILKSQREANEKLKAEIIAKAKAESKVKKDAELKADAELKSKQQAEAKAAKAPKKQKLNDWVHSFSILPIPNGVNSDKTAIEIIEKFESFKKWAKNKIETL